MKLYKKSSAVIAMLLVSASLQAITCPNASVVNSSVAPGGWHFVRTRDSAADSSVHFVMAGWGNGGTQVGPVRCYYGMHAYYIDVSLESNEVVSVDKLRASPAWAVWDDAGTEATCEPGLGNGDRCSV
ncbi:MAG: hypothetical protein P1U34_07715 [Coxiellaceae bacterium]|nr:hypothetical protein [Coxiellaceae bacterium]